MHIRSKMPGSDKHPLAPAAPPTADRRRPRAAAAIAISALLAAAGAAAQPGAVEATAEQRAPYDLTGYWVAIVTEDWRWRMMTPPPGDYASVPMTAAARDVADAWDPAHDRREGNECRPFGAGGIMRVPGRLHITWEDGDTLRVDTDAGTQTRRFHFGEFTPNTSPTWQGNSVAEWQMTGPPEGRARTPGNLKVVTTGVRPGYVRWNGVPYSEDAVITEYFDYHEAFDRDWFTVTTVIDDPVYFRERFIVSSHFRREADGSGFDPTPCVTEAPAVESSPSSGG